MTCKPLLPAALLALLLAACTSAPDSPAAESAATGTSDTSATSAASATSAPSAASAASKSTSTKTALAATPRSQVLLISIDGLRADALDWGITPTLSALAARGVRAQWMNPSYPALTFPNHYTLVTGLRPDHHGIVHNTMEDPDLGGFKVSNTESTRDPRWWGGEPIWVGAEKAGLRSASWAWPGSHALIGGYRPGRVHAYHEHIGNDTRVDQVARWLSDPSLALATLYFEQVDKAGHDHGPQSPQYRQAIAGVDAALGRLLRDLQRQGTLARTDIVIVSDHGMATVPPRQVIAVEDMVPFDQAKVVSIGQSVGIAPRAGQEATASARLLGAHAHYDCWKKQDLPARWRYGTHARIPPIVCQMHEGWDALPATDVRARHAGGVRGSHGFDPALPSMRAVFVAAGPSFLQGRTLPPFDNVDVYPMVAHLLGIAAAPNDGDARTLMPALKEAPPTR